MKKILISYLELMGHVVIDKGPDHFDPNDDYPDFVSLVAEGVAEEGSETMGCHRWYWSR